VIDESAATHEVLDDTLASLRPEGPGASDLVSARLGRFTVLRRLGVGGMGEVFAAYDEELDRKVAVKLLKARDDDARERGRILREAQAMARLSDPNVAQIYDVGVYAGQVFVAMEFIDGPTLGAWQRQAPRGVAELLAVYIQAGRGLQAAHAAGLVHRDFKPENVLIGGDGRVRVVDFGLARARDDADADAVDPLVVSGSVLTSPLTMTGALMGTPAFMAPEQWRGGATDGRTDQFSFCVALWDALYGRRPFPATNFAELSNQVLTGQLHPPLRPVEVPERIHAALVRGLSTDPARRWPSMAELLRQLELDPGRDPALAARTRRRFMIGFLAVGGLNVVWVQATLGDANRPEDSAASFAALMLIATLIGVLSVRRSLLQNSFHRAMLTYLVLVVGQLFAQRVVSAVAGYTMRDIFILDALGMSLVSAAVGALVARWAWIIAGINLAAALVSAARPGVEPVVVPIVFAVSMLIFVYGWHRTASAAR